MAQLKRRKFTIEEFYRMVPACILGEDTLEELIDGDVMVRALQTNRHSLAISCLFRQFISADTSGFDLNVQCPIRLDRYNEPVADMALLSADFDSREHPGPADVLLAIEVADTLPEIDYDLETKLRLYALYGVPEVWLVRLGPGIIEVNRNPADDGYREVARYRRGDDMLTIQKLPGIQLTVDELLA